MFKAQAVAPGHEMEAAVLGVQGELIDRLLLGQDITESDSLIKGPEDQIDAAPGRLGSRSDTVSWL